jgi:hypothetical protein
MVLSSIDEGCCDVLAFGIPLWSPKVEFSANSRGLTALVGTELLRTGGEEC